MKKTKILFIAIVGSLLGVSCLVDDDAPKQEFTQTPFAIGFKNSSYSAAFFTDAGDVDYKLNVDLIGGMNNTTTPAQSFQFEIDPSSTAIAGTEYEIVTANNTGSIAAATDFGSIDFIIKTANLSTSSTSTIVVNLISNVGGIVSATKSQATITLAGLCNSVLAGDYIWEPGNFDTPSTVTQVGPGLYRASYTPPFSGTFWFEFQDICNVLTVTDFEFQASNPMAGTGTVLPSGDLSFTGVSVGGVPWYTSEDWVLVKQ